MDIHQQAIENKIGNEKRLAGDFVYTPSVKHLFTQTFQFIVDLTDKSKAPRGELMDELNRKRAWVQSATGLEFRD